MGLLSAAWCWPARCLLPETDRHAFREPTAAVCPILATAPWGKRRMRSCSRRWRSAYWTASPASSSPSSRARRSLHQGGSSSRQRHR